MSSPSFFFLIYVFFLLQRGTFSMGLVKSQYNALKTLYDVTRGVDWIWDESSDAGPIWNFTDDSDPCDPIWQGLTCNKLKTQVTALFLDNYGLNGSLPSSVDWYSSLSTSLNSLELYNNFLQGQIPQSIGNLTLLTYLRLDNNQLTGPLPDSLGNLRLLIELALEENQLSGHLINLVDRYHHPMEVASEI